MLALRLVRKFGAAPQRFVPAAIDSIEESSSSVRNRVLKLDEPALIKLKKERDPDKLFSLFKANAHNKVVVENRFAFQDTVSRLAGAGRLDYIENLLEHQKSLPQGRREGFVIRIVMLYGSARMVEHAVKTFHDMHMYGCKRTVKSFNATLKVLTQLRDLEAVTSFLRDVKLRYDIEIDIYSINIVIKAFCELGALEDACLVMAQMEKHRITPDVITYTTLIAALYKADRPEIANGLWNMMVLEGCLPNVATFNARIQFLVSKGRAWEANELLAFMRYHKRFPYFPDEATYNLVIKGFCRAGYFEMALRVFSALHNEGYKPNEKIYQTMIHYFCEAGKYDVAYTMCKDSMQKNWFPSVHSICNLLEGLQKDGGRDKLDKAKHIYSLAMKRIPRFPASQIATMKAIMKKLN